MSVDLSGTAIHQKILSMLLEVVKEDPNVRAFIIFGSLVRGDWDKYSDLDLDIVVHETQQDLIDREVTDMVDALQRQIKILHHFEEHHREFVFIFDTLDRMSIRFHTLEDTHPAIISSMRILYGDLTKEQIKASQNRELKKPTSLQMLHNKFLEHAIYARLSIKRDRLINAAFFLNKMRQTILEIYVLSRDKRIFDFEQIADKKIRQDITNTYFLLESESLMGALGLLIDIYKTSIKEISSGGDYPYRKATDYFTKGHSLLKSRLPGEIIGLQRTK
ncbi:MAG: aminoglycoside 6-adenylyltransferase [Patescibacteria group bacterium]